MSGTVLFVDDDPSIVNAVSEILREGGEIDVVGAESGEAALEVLNSRDIDLVVSDHTMPGMSGLQLLCKVRELEPDMPLVMLTGFRDAVEKDVLKTLGETVAVLDKPWDKNSLRGVVSERLAERADRREEADLIEFGGVSREQIERTRKIMKRMQQPGSLGQVLVDTGAITPETLVQITNRRRSKLSIVSLLNEDGALGEEAFAKYDQARQENPDLSERELLVDSRLVTEEQFLRAVSVKHEIPFLDPTASDIDPEVLAKTSIRYLLKNKVLPVRMVHGELETVLADPLNPHLLMELERLFEVKIRPACGTGKRIGETLLTLERLRAGQENDESTSLQYRIIEETPEVEDTGKEAVQIVDYLLLRAIQLGASDLHIEPMESKVRVRVRIDGVLQRLTDLPIDSARRLVSRVKVLAGVDIAEKRLHQDGKLAVMVEGCEVDIRFSSYVSTYGETLVLRLLDRNRNLMTMEDVGFQPTIRAVVEDVVLKTSSGLVVITGPTGSGKTTTLYSFVDHALDPNQKVITAEDPVEYVLDEITQCSVNEKTGPTYAQSLRSILRQDPDTIVVGEMRDPVTAGMAFECALTGHKVYTTFHTEDSVTVFIRLLEMGLEPFLIASSLSTVVAQRLVRRLCPKCRVQAKPSRMDLRFLSIERADLRDVPIWEPRGCGHCDGTGYKGRLGIHEVLIPDDDFRDAVLRRASARELREQARKLPEFLTMQEDALLKVALEQTTLSEIVASAPRDLNARPLSTLRKIGGRRNQA